LPEKKLGWRWALPARSDNHPLPESAMGLFTKDIKSMEDLYLHVLQDIYYAENQIKKALPDMIEKATDRELTAAFKAHLEETDKQIGRLEQAFQVLGKEPKGTPARRSMESSRKPMK
jgi:hypothetical protein